MPQGPEATVTTLCVASYTTAVPITPDCADGETDRLLALLDPKAVLVSSGRDAQARNAAYRLGTTVIEVQCPDPATAMIDPVTAMEDFSSYPLPAQPGDTAVQIVANHATGETQCLTHQSVLASATQLVAGLSLGPDDRLLQLVPMWEKADAVNEVLATLQSGGCVVCPPTSPDGVRFLDWLDECRPTWFTADTQIQSEILELGSSRGDTQGVNSIRFVQADEPDISPDVREGLERMFNTKVVNRRNNA